MLNIQTCPSNATSYQDLVIKTGFAPPGAFQAAPPIPAAALTWQGANGDYSPIAGVRGDFASQYVYNNNDPPTSGFRHGALADWIVAVREPFSFANTNEDRCRIGDIYDGTQNTIMFAEQPIRNHPWRLGVKVNNSMTARWSDAAVPVPGFPPGLTGYWGAVGGGMWGEILFGVPWFAGSLYDGGNLLIGDGGPCLMCTNEQGRGIRSFHPGGSHVAMCDGAVHFLSENMAQRPFGYMITREKNEPLSQFTAP